MEECIVRNTKRILCLWHSFIGILMIFFSIGLYIFIKETSVTGAALLLTGALGLMFVIFIYTNECMVRFTS